MVWAGIPGAWDDLGGATAEGERQWVLACSLVSQLGSDGLPRKPEMGGEVVVVLTRQQCVEKSQWVEASISWGLSKP